MVIKDTITVQISCLKHLSPALTSLPVAEPQSFLMKFPFSWVPRHPHMAPFWQQRENGSNWCFHYSLVIPMLLPASPKDPDLCYTWLPRYQPESYLPSTIAIPPTKQISISCPHIYSLNPFTHRQRHLSVCQNSGSLLDLVPDSRNENLYLHVVVVSGGWTWHSNVRGDSTEQGAVVRDCPISLLSRGFSYKGTCPRRRSPRLPVL